MSEIDRDTQNWLDILSGQERPEADTETVQEAEALREALLARQDPIPLKSTTLDNVLTRLAKQDETDRKVFIAKRNYTFSIAASVVVVILTGGLVQHFIFSRTEDEKPLNVAQTSDSLISKGSSVQQEDTLCPERLRRVAQVLEELEQLGLKYQLKSATICEPSASRADFQIRIKDISSASKTELEKQLKQYQLEFDYAGKKKELTIKL
jgi:hypothetical protein